VIPCRTKRSRDRLLALESNGGSKKRPTTFRDRAASDARKRCARRNPPRRSRLRTADASGSHRGPAVASSLNQRADRSSRPARVERVKRRRRAALRPPRSSRRNRRGGKRRRSEDAKRASACGARRSAMSRPLLVREKKARGARGCQRLDVRDVDECRCKTDGKRPSQRL